MTFNNEIEFMCFTEKIKIDKEKSVENSNL